MKKWIKKYSVKGFYVRQTIFWSTFFILFFLFLWCFLFVPVLVSELKDYTSIESTGEYAEKRFFAEHKRGRTRYDTRLVLKLKNVSTEFQISEDYHDYWRAILKYGNRSARFKVFMRPGHSFVNPMQVEADGRVLLPLAYHKKITTISMMITAIIGLFCIWVLMRAIKKYRSIHLAKDKLKWSLGFKGKMRVIGSFIFWG